ncbi:hypothetical protein [Altibacter sp. HG106]|uniref:hypothetical protein n=1 Tax=Altibacter sp. HG106 TaxID=3023937 RepID=UPI002350D6EC|nr:hypothetical protein [Altibacter sp. HG106]MDC7996353.1 hypothetical protein [Altibacter sp. HG106]
MKNVEKIEHPQKQNKRVNITFDKEINGYTVNIIWSPFREMRNIIIGPAVLQFHHPTNNKSFEIITDYFSIDSKLINVEKDKYDILTSVQPDKIEIDYTKFKLLPDNTLGQQEMPFFFFDIDFDGNLELIITEYGREENFITKYKVFKLIESDLAGPKNQITNIDPYNKIYKDTKIDSKAKRIINN